MAGRAARQRSGRAFDVVIANGRIVDGTGAPWFRGDIGIRGDRIAAIGALGGCRRHDADRRGQSRRRARIHRSARAVGVQRARGRPRGEQDHAGGHDRGDGRGLVDRAGQRSPDRRTRRPTRSISASPRTGARSPTTSSGWRSGRIPRSTSATFVGAGGIRNYVIGKDDRPATPAELEQMKALVAQAMQQGALGAQHVAAVRAGPVRIDRRDRRAGEGRGEATAASISRTSARRARASSSRSTKCSRSPNARRSRRRSGI